MIYLDNAATTKVDENVLKAVMPWFTETYGNASSSHEFGEICNNKIEEVRKQVAKYIGGKSENVYFCSSSSEANSWFYKDLDYNKEWFAGLQIDHADTIMACKELTHGSLLTVDNNGMLAEDDYDYHWICFNLVNAEIGVIQNIKKISSVSHKYGCKIFCDLTQAIGHMPINIKELKL